MPPGTGATQRRGRAAAGTGIFHVTTNLPAVLAAGRLRSRAELRRERIASAGLGGGFRDEAAHLISTGMTLNGSLRVMQAVRVMADAVHGRIDSQSALRELQCLSADRHAPPRKRPPARSVDLHEGRRCGVVDGQLREVRLAC